MELYKVNKNSFKKNPKEEMKDLGFVVEMEHLFYDEFYIFACSAAPTSNPDYVFYIGNREPEAE